MTKYRLVRDVAPFKQGDKFTLTHEHGITAYVPVGTRDVSGLLPPRLLDEMEVGLREISSAHFSIHMRRATDGV